MQTTATVVILGLGILWLFQYALTFWQLRRYSKRLSELRRGGLTWVGLNGSAWKGRTYAVVVVNKENRIVQVEQLSGMTVLAALKPVPGMAGRPVSDLTDKNVVLPVSNKLLLALRDAAKHMEAYAQKQAEKAAELKAAAEEEAAKALVDCTSPQS